MRHTCKMKWKSVLGKLAQSGTFLSKCHLHWGLRDEQELVSKRGGIKFQKDFMRALRSLADSNSWKNSPCGWNVMNKLEKDTKWGESALGRESFKSGQCFWSLWKRTENILIEFVVGELPIHFFCCLFVCFFKLIEFLYEIQICINSWCKCKELM